MAESQNNEMEGNDYYDYDVIVVGAGVAGASAVHHLLQDSLVFPSKGTRDTSDIHILVVDSGPAPGEGRGDDGRKSGSATMTHLAISKIKMMVQVFNCASQEFVKHHGKEGARRYFQATKEGLEIQKRIAKALQNKGTNSPEIMSELGSYYVSPIHQQGELHAEFDFYRSLGECCEDVEFIDGVTRTMDQVPGASVDFPCAIYFPKEAIIDSSEYAKRLLAAAVATGKVTRRSNTRVQHIVTPSRGKASVILDGSGETISSRFGVVVATGAMDSLPPELNGLIRPCYSYLAHVPIETPAKVEESPNFFTWGFSHDWCFAGGQVRVSGEDHFCAYKNPKVKERCGRLINWARGIYGCPSTNDNDHGTMMIPQQYGLYSETPDHVPLIGTTHDDSAVCYLLGCNAWGQTILSYSASLVPGLLGFRSATDGKVCLSESQRDSLKLLSIRRFSELPALKRK